VCIADGGLGRVVSEQMRLSCCAASEEDALDVLDDGYDVEALGAECWMLDVGSWARECREWR